MLTRIKVEPQALWEDGGPPFPDSPLVTGDNALRVFFEELPLYEALDDDSDEEAGDPPADAVARWHAEKDVDDWQRELVQEAATLWASSMTAPQKRVTRRPMRELLRS